MGGCGKITVMSSGSCGNCIAVLDSRGKYVLLDVGIRYKEILKSMSWNLSSCIASLCTHLHSDHSKALYHFIESGIPCYANQDVCDHYKGCNLIDRAILIDGWKVQTFGLVHNVPNNAFILDTFDGIRILYCTDTEYVPQIVRNVHYAIIECNYDDEILIDALCDGKHIRSQFENHHSLERCVDYLKKIYNPNLQAIILSHISDSNGDPKMFQQRVKDELGFENVYCATGGLEIPLQLSEF
jgi:phosphoribosyl 1,2-cyclic phosphodiesterase